MGETLIQDSYQAQSMITLTEYMISEDTEQEGEPRLGTYRFNTGVVDVVAEGTDTLRLTAVTLGDFQRVQRIAHKKPAQDEPVDETEAEDESSLESSLDEANNTVESSEEASVNDSTADSATSSGNIP